MKQSLISSGTYFETPFCLNFPFPLNSGSHSGTRALACTWVASATATAEPSLTQQAAPPREVGGVQMEEAGSQSQTPDPLGHKQGLEEGWGGPWHPTPLRRRLAHLPQAAHPSVSSAPGCLGSSRPSSSNKPLSRAGQLLGLAPWGLPSLVLGGASQSLRGCLPEWAPASWTTGPWDSAAGLQH